MKPHTTNADFGYLELLLYVMTAGETRTDRTGTGTRSVFGAQLEHDMSVGFPLLTTKRVGFKSSCAEACWIIRGDTNIKFLNDRGSHIWDAFADEDGSIGKTYGRQLRSWSLGVSGHPVALHEIVLDQLVTVVEQLKADPFSRRHWVSLWNPADARAKMPPCQTGFQLYVQQHRPAGMTKLTTLDLHVHCRSSDIFLGLPFDLSLYGLILEVIANMTGHKPGRLVMSFGDLHLYSNHLEQATEQLSRRPKLLPGLEVLRDLSPENIDTLDTFDFALRNYAPHGPIPAPLAV